MSPNLAERNMFQAVLSRLHGPEVAVAVRTGWHKETLSYVMPNGAVIGDRPYASTSRTTERHRSMLAGAVTIRSGRTSLPSSFPATRASSLHCRQRLPAR